MQSSAEKIRCYKESLKSAWGYNDYNDWPIKFNSVMHLFLEEFAQEILEDLKDVRESGLAPSKIAESFGNPARVYRLINSLLYGMKRLGCSITEQRETTCFFLDLVQLLKYGSPFNEDGRNIILDPEAVRRTINRVKMHKVVPGEELQLQQFCGIMWAYTEAIFFRAHDVTKEVHGPYRLENGNQLLIRRYMNLRPNDMLPLVSLLDCSELIVYTEYDETLRLTVDSYNHLFLHRGNYRSDLRSFAIECDGEMIGIPKLQEKIGQMQKTIQQIHLWSSEVNWREVTLRYADIYWYRKKPLRALVGRSQTIPDRVRRKINEGQPDERRKTNLSDRQIDLLIQLIL